MIHIYSVPLFFGAAQTLLVVAFIWKLELKNSFRWIMTAIQLIIGYQFLAYGVSISQVSWSALGHQALGLPTLALVGLFHSFLSRAITHQNGLLRSLLGHSAAIFAFFAAFYGLAFAFSDFSPRVVVQLGCVLSGAIALFYLWTSSIRLRSFVRAYEQQGSDPAMTHIRFLCLYSDLFLAAGVLFLAAQLPVLLSACALYAWLLYCATLLTVVFVILISVEMVSHASTYDKLALCDDPVQENSSIQLNEADRQHILDKIHRVMNDQQVFLDEDLRIAQLAGLVHEPGYLVSKAINEGLGCNFFEFVNRYRVQKAEQLLSSTDHKILAIAFDSGFSNKTRFNRTFKRFKGTTPSEYRREIRCQITSAAGQ